MLNRKFVRADNAKKNSEEAANAVTETTYNLRRSFSLRIHESKSKRERAWLEAYRNC